MFGKQTCTSSHQNWPTRQLYKVSTLCIDDHHFKEEELKSVGELWKVCSQIVLKCLYLSRIGPLDILWSVNKLARSVTKWTKACDKRLSRLISYIHHTCDYKQYCRMGNTAKQCRLGLFQDSDFAGDLEDSKSTSGGTLCIFGSHTFVPISWMCKKQTSVSHSSFNRIRIHFLECRIEDGRYTRAWFMGSDRRSSSREHVQSYQERCISNAKENSWKDWWFLGVHSTRMRNEQRYCGQLQRHDWIQDLCRSKRKATLFREICRVRLLMVLWFGRSCKEMCGAIWWY